MLKFKRSIIAFAGLLLLAGALGTLIPLVSHGQGNSQQPPQPVRDVDNPARKPYGVSLRCGTDTGNVCQAAAPAVPAGKRLVIEHVSATIQLRQTFERYTVLLQPPGGDIQGVSFLPATLTFTDSVFNNYVINESVLVYVEAGVIPSIQASTTGNGISTSAFLSGYLVDL